MATMEKTYLGGVMAKSVKMQVFLEPTTYLEVVNEARNVGINARTDSELVRKILFKFFQDLPMLALQIENLKKAIAQKNTIIEELQEKMKNEPKSKQRS